VILERKYLASLPSKNFTFSVHIFSDSLSESDNNDNEIRLCDPGYTCQERRFTK
jgi:hypothetical protein